MDDAFCFPFPPTIRRKKIWRFFLIVSTAASPLFVTERGLFIFFWGRYGEKLPPCVSPLFFPSSQMLPKVLPPTSPRMGRSFLPFSAGEFSRFLLLRGGGRDGRDTICQFFFPPRETPPCWREGKEGRHCCALLFFFPRKEATRGIFG